MIPIMLNMSISELQQQVVEEFSLFSDWMEKYEYLIELGRALPPFPEENKRDENLIAGCQSRVWLYVQFKNGILTFSADSDAIITKGIVSLLIHVFSGHSPNEIIESEMDFIDKIGLKDNLSPTRANGLLSMINKIKIYATIYKDI